MSRYVLLVVAVLGLCALAAADFWPAGKPGAEELEAQPIEASIMAKSKSKDRSKHSDSHKHGGHSYKSRYHLDKSKKTSKTKKTEKVPEGEHPKGYYAAPPGKMPKDDDEWFEGEGDHNMPRDHIEEHAGDCIGSRHVSVTGPVNTGGVCPPQSDLFDAQRCDVPAFCGKNGSPFTSPLAACACPEGEFLRFDAGMVEDHFLNQPGPFPMVDATKQTYECVDARGEGPMLGTPGGDLAELMAAAMAVMKLRNVPYSKAIADEVFDIFTEQVASPDRPLYFHTDDGSLRRMFRFLQGKLLRKNGQKPSIFPWRGPEGADGETWLSALQRAEFNGCGHIRLMINTQTTGFYSVQLARGVAACGAKLDKATCVDAGALAQRIIENYFRYWWFTPSGSDERQKAAFAVDGILEGPLLGKAVTVIQNKAGTEGDSCPGHHPMVNPSFGASQVFVYHGQAVGQWRAFVGKEYFGNLAENYDFTVDELIATWTDIASMQLGSTLTYLEPANRVGLFVVDVPVKYVGDEDEEGGYYGPADEPEGYPSKDGFKYGPKY